MNKEGYLIFKVFEPSELPELRKNFKEACKDFPEFLEVTDEEYVLGGFGALGNPSSFHNYFTRYIRFRVFQTVKKLLEKDFKGKYIQGLFDRLLIRPSGKAPSKESWHRDVTPGLKETSFVFGGWVNLDNENNHFSCVPGTQAVQKESGFVKLKDQKFTGEKIEIHPGHGIIFHQSLIHEVLPTKLKHTSYRIFHGFHISEENENIFDYSEIIENQGVPPLPSGQIPPMFAKLHWVNWRDKLEIFSRKLKPECLEVKSGGAPKSRTIVHRFMKSLKEYGFPLYREYDPKEIEILNSQVI
jgi:hypothetical protein